MTRGRTLSGARWIAALAVAASVAPAELAGQAPGQDALVRIDSLVARGVARLTAEQVIGTAGIQPGTTNSWIDIQRAIKNLWATGLYDDVVFRLDSSGGRNTLILEVVERPMARYIRITGLESVSRGEVIEETGLRENAPLSRNDVVRAEAFIRDELRREGVPFAVIRRREQPVPGEAGRVDVVIEVEEGQRVTIARVTFNGNAHFSNEELRGAMRTKPEGFLWYRTGTYDEIDFELDLLRALPAHYSEAGYLDFEIIGDTLIIDPETGKARLEIAVDEGPQYRLAELVIEGAESVDEEMLRQYFEAETGGILSALGVGGGRSEDETGQIFNLVEFEQAAQRVRDVYSNEGYLYAQVEPSWTKTGEEEGGHPTVRAELLIGEGPQAYVRNVIIQGNDYTFDRVIREKIFVLPGDVYSQDRILQSYQNIQSLGFFETPLPPPDIRPDYETGDVDIIFSVVEKQTGTMSFGTAVGGGVGLSGFVGFDQPNILGQGKAGSIRWDFGRYINSFTLSLTDPALLQSTISGSFSVYNSTDRFFQFATGRRRRAGFTTQFGVPFFNSLQTRVFFGYSLSRTSYEAFNSAEDRTLFGLPPGILSTFSVGITRNTLNHPLFPTSGSMQSWNVELNGGPLGGEGDFIKHTGQAQWKIPLGQLGGGEGLTGGTRFALGLGVRAGALFGDASRFPFESFWLGGVQFGQPLRGYDETSITPFGYFPDRNAGISQVDRTGNAYMSTTAEYTAVFGSNVSVSAFYDAGNIWRGPGDLNTSRLYRGAGVGVQLLTPFGPLGMDYAYGFDKVDPATGLPAPGWQLHFKMGPNF